MDISSSTTVSPLTSSLSPCSTSEATTAEGVEGVVEEWLEDETVAGFRVWQLAGIVLSIILAIIVGLCCCIRFRIPRTKQEIEADYIRKKITKNFRKELAKFSDNDMDEMSLKLALERVQANLDAESQEMQQKQRDEDDRAGEKSPDGLRARFRAMVDGMRTRLTKNAATASTGVSTGIPRPIDNEV